MTLAPLRDTSAGGDKSASSSRNTVFREEQSGSHGKERGRECKKRFRRRSKTEQRERDNSVFGSSRKAFPLRSITSKGESDDNTFSFSACRQSTLLSPSPSPSSFGDRRPPFLRQIAPSPPSSKGERTKARQLFAARRTFRESRRRWFSERTETLFDETSRCSSFARWGIGGKIESLFFASCSVRRDVIKSIYSQTSINHDESINHEIIKNRIEGL